MASSSSLSKHSRWGSAIKEPEDYDVLMGRGAGAREHFGNKQFRAWVEPLKIQYALTRSFDVKNDLAGRVVDMVRSHKGRFLEIDEAKGVYKEISTSRALLKTKQALREKPLMDLSMQQGDPAVTGSTWAARGDAMPGPSVPSSARPGMFGGWNDTLTSRMVSNGPRVSPFSNDPGTSWSCIPPQRLQTTPTMWNLMMNQWGFIPQPAVKPRYRGSAVACAAPEFSVASQFPMEPPVLRVDSRPLPAFSPPNHYIPHDSRPFVDQMNSIERKVSVESQVSSPRKSSESKEEASASLPIDSTVEEEDYDDSQHLTEEEIAAARFLFSELTTPEHPLQDEILTEEEKSDAIADLFGDLCTITPQPRKRIKRSAAPSISKEVSILLLQMKKEIELMPNKDKQAWLEASRKARESEIDGRRQELFLRREDMDPTRAARRWVTYWEERRRFFGPDKFCLPMTLHGAMRDDHVAIDTGFARILPGLDDSGQQMSLAIMRKHTRDGYSTDSMIRYAFYNQDVLCQHSNAAKGVVRFNWYKGSTMLDTDRTFEWTVTDLQNRAFPIPACATHSFCLPLLVARLLAPISLAQLDKNTRARCVIHHVKESQVVDALSEYGIRKEVIPREMGGDCNYSHSQYLADRRAFESEWEHVEEGQK